jgi:choline monooxygenase
MVSRWTLPAKLYVDAVAFEKEMQCLFRRSWVLFGATQGRLEEEGSAWASTVVPRTPLVALRTKGGKARIYHNVCRHRAGPLVFDGEHTRGTKGLLTCKYHKWCYSGESGKLLSAPHYGDPCLQKEDFALRSVGQVEERSGFLFYRMESSDMESLDEVYGDIWDRIASVTSVGSLRYLGSRTHHLRCNWKTYVENYAEGYHIPAVHPGLSHAFDSNTYQVIPHSRYKYCEHRVDPVAGAPPSPYKGVWYFLWPNLALNVYSHGMTVEQIVPTGVDSCEIRYTDLVQRNFGTGRSPCTRQ